MKWKFYLYILLVCLAFVLVKSESYIEIDEDGNEYEVKRFHIQGRQLNDPKQQCVVTRRRRQYNAVEEATASLVAQAMDGVDMKEPEKQEAEDDKDELFEDKEDEDDSKDDLIQVDSNDDHKTPAGIADKSKLEKNEEDQVKPEVPKTEEVSASAGGTDLLDNFDQKPGKLIKVKKEKVQKVTVLRPQAENEPEEAAKEDQTEQVGHPLLQSIQLHPSALVSNTAANSFVIIEAPKPQNVVSIPGNPFLSALPTDQDYQQNGDAFTLPLSYAFSEEPVTTSAIWSTGEDTPQNPFNRIKDEPVKDYEEETAVNTYPDPNNEGDYNSAEVVENAEGSLLTEQNIDETSPASVNKNKKKKNKNTNKKKRKRRPSKRPNRRPNRNRNKSKKKQSKRKPPGSYIVKRRHYTNSSNRNKNRSGNRGSNRPVQNHSGHQSNNLRSKKKKQKPGIMSTTYSVTETRTGEDSNIECIIIEKEPKTTPKPRSTTTTTTTRRPFWNILGRTRSNAGQPRDFGNRKRANLRFIAK